MGGYLPEEAPQTVSYPITTILDRMDAKLDRIDSKLDGKADRSDLKALEERVATLETGEAARREGSEVAREHDAEAKESRRSSLALAISAAAVLAVVGEGIVQAVTHGH